MHLGRAGRRVALVERRPDPDALQARVRALHPVERRPVPRPARRAGRAGGRAARARARLDADTGGSRAARAGAGSISVRREVLDPLLRRTAAETPGVELLLGHAVDGVEPGRGEHRVSRTLTADVVIGADGRGSRTAKLAGLAHHARAPNARFAYWGYFQGPPLGTGASVHLWMLDDGGRRHRHADRRRPDALRRLPAARARARRSSATSRASLRAFVGALPDAPPIGESRPRRPDGRQARPHERVAARHRSPPGAGGRRRARRRSRSARSAAAGRCSRPSGSRRRSVAEPSAGPRAGGLPAPAPARAPRALQGRRRQLARPADGPAAAAAVLRRGARRADRRADRQLRGALDPAARAALAARAGPRRARARPPPLDTEGRC